MKLPGNSETDCKNMFPACYSHTSAPSEDFCVHLSPPKHFQINWISSVFYTRYSIKLEESRVSFNVIIIP